MMRNRMHSYNNIRLWSFTGNRGKKLLKLFTEIKRVNHCGKKNFSHFKVVYILQDQQQRILIDGEHVLTRLFYLLTSSTVLIMIVTYK